MGDNEPVADPTLSFSTVDRSPSLYEVVSERLLAAIRDAGFPPGSKIPSERELGEQFGVSRTVVREAIRHLAAKGVLDTRSSRGVVVADVGHDGVSESLELYLSQRDGLAPDQIVEVREALELAIVRVAVARASEAQITAIREASDAMASAEDVDKASIADVEFHRALAAATGNPLFEVLVDSLRDVILRMRVTTLVDPDRGRVAAAEHRRIADALERRDEAAAVDAMRDHLSHSVEAYSRALEH